MERYQVRFRCGFLLTPLREGRPPIVLALSRIGNDFYSRPCGRGDVTDAPYTYTETEFLLTPLREGRRGAHRYRRRAKKHFYSRPCGRGDPSAGSPYTTPGQFLLTPLREGRRSMINTKHVLSVFLLTPLREGRRPWGRRGSTQNGFLLTPLREGRRASSQMRTNICGFLLTPLREGRLYEHKQHRRAENISTHAPAGGATCELQAAVAAVLFLLTPLREGRPLRSPSPLRSWAYFYSRPCGRGDPIPGLRDGRRDIYFYSRPCGRGDEHRQIEREDGVVISTHAPAGGATAIFHKSVMRFCGKLPKDDTVLCLASFGFPRRDPKAVYLAWISCANLPQKCVREGLALKDQGTSCFHEGLASHAFDPVLV